MAVFNTEEYVAEAIESILSQTFQDFELIIVNDGSIYSTTDILKRYDDPRIKLIHQSNQGCVKARERGIRIAKGEYLAIMDADDIALPKRLEKTAKYLDTNPNVVLVGTGYIIRNEPTKTEEIVIPPSDDFLLRRCLLRSDPFKDPTLLIRKSAFLRAGGYKVDHGFDYELYSRIAKFGELANIEDVLLITRQHPLQFFRVGHTPEQHRKRRLKIRWLTLWRLKPPYPLFIRTLLWLNFEFFVNLLPEDVRHKLPGNVRTLLKSRLPPNVVT